MNQSCAEVSGAHGLTGSVCRSSIPCALIFSRCHQTAALRQQRRHPGHILARCERSYWSGCGEEAGKLLCDMFEMQTKCRGHHFYLGAGVCCVQIQNDAAWNNATRITCTVIIVKPHVGGH